MAGKNVVIVTDQNFESEILKSDKPALVDFTATWCGPCKQISPMIEEIANETVGVIKVAKLDIDDAPNTAVKLGIRGVPTIVAFKGGKEVARHVGAGTNKAKLRALVG